TLYNVYVLAGEGDDGLQTLAYYDSITLQGLSQQTFNPTEGQGLRLFASSTPGGPYDVELATGDPFLEANVTVFPTSMANNYFLQASDSSTGGFPTLATVPLGQVAPPPPPPGVSVTPTRGLITTEEGGTGTFTVVLDAEPTADVTIAVSSSDPAEA